jgi:ABC-type transport system involved in multi-copper enzyme maturation permease subunit
MIKKRKALMSIGIALILLIFSIVAVTVISNLSSNLIKNISEMDIGKEDQYKRVVIRSLQNILENDVYDYSTFSVDNYSSTIFKYSLSREMVKGSNNGLIINFPATALFISDDSAYFFELYTEPSTSTSGNLLDTYGIVLQFATTTNP